MCNKFKLFISGIILFLFVVFLWMIYVNTEQQRLRTQVVSALATQDAVRLFATMGEEEKKELNITPDKIEHILKDIGFWSRQRKGGRPFLWVSGGNNPLMTRNDWVVEWFDSVDAPLAWPASAGEVMNPFSGITSSHEFSVLTFNKPCGWTFYILPGWRFNFSSLVFSHCFFNFPDQDAEKIRRSVYEGNDVPGYLNAEGVVRRFSEMD